MSAKYEKIRKGLTEKGGALNFLSGGGNDFEETALDRIAKITDEEIDDIIDNLYRSGFEPSPGVILAVYALAPDYIRCDRAKLLELVIFYINIDYVTLNTPDDILFGF